MSEPSTSVTTMASVQDKVRERIQASFMEFLPEEMFQGLVKTELDNFVKNIFPKLVQEAAKEQMMKVLKSELAKPDWQGMWNTNTQDGSEMVKIVLKELAPEMIATMFGQMAQTIVSNMRNQRGY